MTTKPQPKYGWHGSSSFAVGARVKYTVPNISLAYIYTGITGTIIDDSGDGSDRLWGVQWDNGFYFGAYEWALAVIPDT